MNGTVKFIEGVPNSLLTGIDISITESWLLYLIILLFFAYLATRRFIQLVLTLALINVFCIFQIREKLDLNSSGYFVVYQVKDSPAINFIRRKENLLITDSTLMSDQQKQLFHIKNNWNKKDAADPIMMDYHLPDSSNKRIISQGLYQFGDDIILHFHDKNKPRKFSSKWSVDILVVSDNLRLKWEGVLKNYSPEVVILDGTNKSYVRTKWKKELEENGIPYWDVEEQGAYVKKHEV